MNFQSHVTKKWPEERLTKNTEIFSEQNFTNFQSDHLSWSTWFYNCDSSPPGKTWALLGHGHVQYFWTVP